MGECADYVAIVASVLPGHTWHYYIDVLPLAIGMQLRNAALLQEGVTLLPPGRSAAAKAREIVGDALDSWLDGRETKS